MEEIKEEIIEQPEEQIEETVSKSQYDELVTELDEVKAKLPIEKSEAELAIEAKQHELWQKELNIELKSVGLDKFADFFNATNGEELQEQIEKFQSILDERMVDNSYKPSDHKATDAYTQAKQKGDPLGMLKSLFS